MYNDIYIYIYIMCIYIYTYIYSLRITRQAAAQGPTLPGSAGSFVGIVVSMTSNSCSFTSITINTISIATLVIGPIAILV